MRTIARLRSGYAGLGYFSKIRTEREAISQIPCPGCDLMLDSSTLLLFECQNPAYVAARTALFNLVREDYGLDPTLSVLLGFDPSVSCQKLRVTTKTARFVEPIDRVV